MFSASSTLSERELISAAVPLASKSEADFATVSRILDVCVAVTMLIVLLPVMLVIPIGILISDPGPIFFAQKRVGKNGRIIKCLKFRTMCVDADEKLKKLLASNPKLREEWKEKQKLDRDPRITRFGQFLRQSSLDELPQLFAIVMGDMSLVGPRPIIEAEIPRYGRFITSYLSVKPGLTGLWQVTGRNNTTYRRRVATDVFYVRSKSLMLDLKILLATIPAVLTGRGSC